MSVRTKRPVCPLCGSLLTRDRYLQIVGVWEERKRLEGSLQRELHQLRDERARLRHENQRMRADMKRNIKDAAAKATAKEKRRADRLSAMIVGKSQQIQVLTHKVKELQEQLKKGTTPQIEGINFEHELVKDLKNNFSGDLVEHHGKSGDILLRVRHRGQQVGSILFECKLTSSFSRSYVVQTKKAIADRNATYGILVTLQSKKGTAGLWVEADVIVVHPFGAVHVAGLLRQSLLDIHANRVGRREADRRAAALFEYVKSDEFRNLVGDTIFRTVELYGLLKKELKSHRRTWKTRFDHYRRLHENSSRLKLYTGAILAGNSPRRVLTAAPKLLPPSF